MLAAGELLAFPTRITQSLESYGPPDGTVLAVRLARSTSGLPGTGNLRVRIGRHTRTLTAVHRDSARVIHVHGLDGEREHPPGPEHITYDGLASGFVDDLGRAVPPWCRRRRIRGEPVRMRDEATPSFIYEEETVTVQVFYDLRIVPGVLVPEVWEFMANEEAPRQAYSAVAYYEWGYDPNARWRSSVSVKIAWAWPLPGPPYAVRWLPVEPGGGDVVNYYDGAHAKGFSWTPCVREE